MFLKHFSIIFIDLIAILLDPGSSIARVYFTQFVLKLFNDSLHLREVREDTMLSLWEAFNFWLEKQAKTQPPELKSHLFFNFDLNFWSKRISNHCKSGTKISFLIFYKIDMLHKHDVDNQ